ncbi:MAG: ABC transporter ATP-binding protein [Planctomycetota bacterium]|nr:ABC transporter ATP-binding protein [Planctomycetota bacterium]
MAEASNEPALRIAGLRMIYNPGLLQKPKLAVDNLDLEVPRGSIFGFLGQNGAGKTSTIKILVGLQFATAGQAWILGTNIVERGARASVGYMPENPYFYEYLTAVETLDFYGQLSGMAKEARRARAAELIESFGLGHARDVPMRQFSKGMRQRLGLAQAILHAPPVVILDEPMSGLDPLGRRDIRNTILSLRDKGCTVFFSSHILSDVADICDRVCVIHRGKKISEGPIHSLLSNRVLEVELAASGVPPEGLPDAAALARRAWHDGALYHLLLADEETAQKAKALLEAKGATIRLLMPHVESLEEYFVRVTGEKPPAPDAKVRGAAE